MSGVQSALDYALWDADKAQSCVCDAGFTGPDCSLRQCPRNDDPIEVGLGNCGGVPCRFEKQAFTLTDAPDTLFRFAYLDEFNGTSFAYAVLNVAGTPNGYVAPASQATYFAGPTTVAGQIQAALRGVGSGALARIEVYAYASSTLLPGSDASRTFVVQFVGVGGNVNPLEVTAVSGLGMLGYNPLSPSYSATFPFEAARAVVTINDGNYESVDCSMRGNCDFATGLCACFSGFVGSACQYQNAISGQTMAGI